MKTINLTTREFIEFKLIARQYKILFEIEIIKGNIFIEADKCKLELIGY